MTGAVAAAVVDVHATPERVWTVLTEPGEIAAWMAGSRVETTWQVGDAITWAGEYDGRAYQDKGEVLVVDEPNELSMTHFSPLTGQDDVPENYHVLVYTLSSAGEDTRLSLTQDGCADDAQAEQFARTWQAMLDGLKARAEA